MNYRTPVAILALVAASCSSATPTTTTTTPTTTSLAPTTTTSSATEPQTCEEVADAMIAINQVFLDELGDMSMEDFVALGAASEQGTPWLALDKLGRDLGPLLTRAADELGCSDQDLQLAFSGDQLTPSGPAGEFWLEINSEGAANGE